jgi:prolyl oligopeptidase
MSSPKHSDVTEILFGETIHDPYRWLEDTGSPEAREWVKREGETARATLDQVPGSNELRRQMNSLYEGKDGIYDVHSANGTLFYLRRHAGELTPSLCSRVPGGEERVLFAAQQVGGAAPMITGVAPSMDGRYVAFNVQQGGSETGVVEVVDAATGKELPDRLEKIHHPLISWVPRAKKFFYFRRPHFTEGDGAGRYKDAQMMLHTLGTPQDQDVIAAGVGARVTPALESNDMPQVTCFNGSNYALLAVYHGTSSEADLYYRSLSPAAANSPWLPAVPSEEALAAWVLLGDELYVISRRGAPFGRIAKMRLGAQTTLQPVFESTSRNLTSLAVSQGAIWATEEDVTGVALRRIRVADGSAEPVPVALEAVTDLVFDPLSRSVLVQAEGWANSPRWSMVDEGDLSAVDPFPDFRRISVADLHIEHRSARSRDGTLVPLTILSPSNLRRDGTAATLLTGYGAFEESLLPEFAITNAVWLQRGGVLAVAHVRGGGELGREWHLGGVLGRKQNSIDDFVACGEYLLQEKYTTRDRLGAYGGSAGGLLVGVAAVQHPDLFRAIHIASGVVDVLRMLTVAVGPALREEFGLPDSKEALRALLQIDAYQQVHAGVRYPATLVSVGLADVRVPFWQGAKLVAKLQESSSSGYPVLLRVVADAGHSASNVTQIANEEADAQSFFLWQFGLLASGPSGAGTARL